MLAKITVEGELIHVSPETTFTRKDGSTGSRREFVLSTPDDDAAITVFCGANMEYLESLRLGDHVCVDVAVECRRGKQLPDKPVRWFTSLKCLYLRKQDERNEHRPATSAFGLAMPADTSLYTDPEDLPF